MTMGDRVDLPLPKSEYQLEVILVGATHPGNLGAVCRTMLNHGLQMILKPEKEQNMLA